MTSSSFDLFLHSRDGHMFFFASVVCGQDRPHSTNTATIPTPLPVARCHLSHFSILAPHPSHLPVLSVAVVARGVPRPPKGSSSFLSSTAYHQPTPPQCHS